MENAGVFEDAAQAWLEATGVLATYRHTKTGAATQLYVTVEQDVTTVDDLGSTTRGEVASLLSSLVPEPARNDRITFGHTEYRVDEQLDDTGHLARLIVTRVQ